MHLQFFLDCTTALIFTVIGLPHTPAILGLVLVGLPYAIILLCKAFVNWLKQTSFISFFKRRNRNTQNQQSATISATAASAQVRPATVAKTTLYSNTETELLPTLILCGSCKEVTSPGTLRLVTKLMNLNWNPELAGVGRDARGLKHHNLQIRHVFRIINKPLCTIYLENYLKLKHRFKTPQELVERPIATTALKDEEEYTLQDGERYLFHGTDRLAIQNIAQHGFDIKYSQGGLFGHPGIYFSEYPQKADQYADKSERRTTDLYMIIARVALGKTELYENKKNDETYDTVVGGTRGNLFREFVKAETDQVYPMFIVNYNRS